MVSTEVNKTAATAQLAHDGQSSCPVFAKSFPLSFLTFDPVLIRWASR